MVILQPGHRLWRFDLTDRILGMKFEGGVTNEMADLLLIKYLAVILQVSDDPGYYVEVLAS